MSKSEALALLDWAMDQQGGPGQICLVLHCDPRGKAVRASLTAPGIRLSVPLAPVAGSGGSRAAWEPPVRRRGQGLGPP